MSSSDGGGPGGSHVVECRRAWQILDLLGAGRRPETGYPLPTFGHAGPIARHPVHVRRGGSPAGADPDVAIAVPIPGPVARHPDELGALGPVGRRDFLNLGRRLIRDHQARLNLQVDRFGKGLMHRAAGQDLGLLLSRGRWGLLGWRHHKSGPAARANIVRIAIAVLILLLSSSSDSVSQLGLVQTQPAGLTAGVFVILVSNAVDYPLTLIGPSWPFRSQSVVVCQFLDCVNRRLDCARTLQDTTGSFYFVNGSVTACSASVWSSKIATVEFCFDMM